MIFVCSVVVPGYNDASTEDVIGDSSTRVSTKKRHVSSKVAEGTIGIMRDTHHEIVGAMNTQVEHKDTRHHELLDKEGENIEM